MLWLLRLFPAFRALESEVALLRSSNAELTQEKLRLQDRLDAALEDRKQLWEMTRECLHGERTSYQSHINQQWQRMAGAVPYPDAPHLPASALPRQQGTEPVGRQGRILPSEAVERRTTEFIHSLVSR